MKKLKCIKQYAGDREQYGVDFRANRKYNISSIEKDGSIYVISESGTDVMINKDELTEYFIEV